MFRGRPKVLTRVRYHGPHEMDPLGAPADFLRKLLVYTVLWEIVRVSVVFVVSRVLPARDDDDEATKRVRFEAPKQYTGLVHALLVSVLAFYILLDVLRASNPADMYYNRGVAGGLSDATRDTIERTNWLFLGYLVHDTVQIVTQFPRLGKVDMLAHHCVFVVASILSGVSQTMMLPFAWLLLGEASTPLLTLRWTIQSASLTIKSQKVVKIAKALGFTGNKVSSPQNAGKQIEFFAGLVLVVIFFLVRVIAYSIGYSHMLWVRSKGLIDAVPSSVAVPLNILVGAGAGLNAYWFGIMIRKAIRGPPEPKKGAKGA